MSSHGREVVLGTVIFLAAVIVVVGSVWLSERYAGASGGYQLRVNFKSITGLQRGNPVTVRGVRVGKVLEIILKDGRPMVIIGFEKLRGLPLDSKVLLKDGGLLGEQIVEVRLGSESSGMFADGDELEGVSMGGVESLTTQAAEAAEHLNFAIGDILNVDNLSRIENFLRHMDSTSASLRKTMVGNLPTISEILDSLAVISTEARQMVGDNREGVSKVVENLRLATERLEKISRTMQISSESMMEMLENFNEVSHKVRNGKGTIGRLVSEEGVYRNIQETLTSVDSLLDNIRQDPSKYFKVKFSLF